MAGAGYFLSFLLVITPAIDYATNITPWRPGSVDWRYAAVGLLSGFLLTPLLGMGIASLLAATGARRERVLAGLVNVLCAATLVILMPLYALDFLQVRASVPAADVSAVTLGGLKALGKHASALIAFLWMGIALLRGLPHARSRGSGSQEPLLMRP
jgi:hypothetical protein